MGARRDQDGWNQSHDPDREAADVLAYLDHLADGKAGLAGELVAHVDLYGVVTSTIALDGGSELYLQAGDGWDRVLWTCPTGRTYEWTWRPEETPGDLNALLAGRGIERTTLVQRRLVGAQLIVDDRTLTVAEGRWRLALIQRMGLSSRIQERPAR